MTKEQIDSLHQISNQTLSQVLEWARQTGEFVKEQTPLLAQEIVKYGIYSNGLYVILSIMVFFIAAYCLPKQKSFKQILDNDNEPEMVYFLFKAVVSIIAIILSIMIFCANISDFIMPLVAPRFYLMDQISKLIK